MPGPSTYPLEPLRAHRERLVEEAEAVLARAIADREGAERTEVEAERARRLAAEQADAVRAEEAACVARGEARALDFARAEAWEHAEAQRAAAHARRVEEARARTGAARKAEAEARATLAGRKADLDVVAKDEAKFAASRARAREAREDEDAAEAFGGRGRSS